MTISKKDLQALNRDITALAKKMEKLLAAFDESQKSKTPKKVPAKKIPAKKVTVRVTATEQVLKIIKGSKNGVNAAALMEKTGFDAKKIQNIVYNARKRGKIESAGKGVYVSA
jgi:hypothetical protein